MPAAIPCHPNGSLQRCSTYFNYAKCSRRHCRSLSVQDATQSTRVASKWADITVAMARFYGYILCRDCCGHYKKEECPSPTLDGQWRCSWCTDEFRGTQRKLATVDWSTLRDGWEFVWRGMFRARAFFLRRQQFKSGPTAMALHRRESRLLQQFWEPKLAATPFHSISGTQTLHNLEQLAKITVPTVRGTSPKR